MSHVWRPCAELAARLRDGEEQLEALKREGSGEASSCFPLQLCLLSAHNSHYEALSFLSSSAERPTDPS